MRPSRTACRRTSSRWLDACSARGGPSPRSSARTRRGPSFATLRRPSAASERGSRRQPVCVSSARWSSSRVTSPLPWTPFARDSRRSIRPVRGSDPRRPGRQRMTRPRLHRWMAVIVTAIAAGTGFSGGAAALDPAAAVPPIHHVWVINLENTSYRDSFGTPANDPYLATTLPGMGALLRQYYGIGHESLDNYIAEISGQAPSVQTQADCPIFSQFIGSAGGLDGQAVGQGCVYPKAVHTLTNQLEAKRLTWKGYMEDMGLD